MKSVSRRDFVSGLAVLGVGGFVLRADARPTPAAGTVGEFRSVLKGLGAPVVPVKFAPTEDCILGPYFRAGAPYRAKVTPPLEAGVILVVNGRVWGYDTKKPLTGARLDIWQANARGRYDNDDPANPPRKDVFVNRARVITDETGYYEFETVHPGPYQIGDDAWRPSHIHYLIAAPGYKTLVTQLFFKGDPHNKTDAFIKDSLIIELQTQKVSNGSYEAGTFDVVLAAK